MPCDTQKTPQQTEADRRAEIDRALKALESAILAGAARMTIGPDGAIAFDGWSETDRKRVSDVCAYRALLARGSWALRQAIAAAETRAGRKVSAVAVAAGRHSHDGGRSWHQGH